VVELREREREQKMSVGLPAFQADCVQIITLAVWGLQPDHDPCEQSD
jgi:hypothetical protein